MLLFIFTLAVILFGIGVSHTHRSGDPAASDERVSAIFRGIRSSRIPR